MMDHGYRASKITVGGGCARTWQIKPGTSTVRVTSSVRWRGAPASRTIQPTPWNDSPHLRRSLRSLDVGLCAASARRSVNQPPILLILLQLQDTILPSFRDGTNKISHYLWAIAIEAISHWMCKEPRLIFT
ncbi:hypothetical protein AB1N83_009879 [Pleurotus pulmonarius]